jgi:hypothetical protein
VPHVLEPATRSETSEIAALLRALIAEVKGLRADGRDRRPSHLTRQDRDRLANILPVVAARRGSELFVVRELFEAESPAWRLVVGTLNARQVGRLLQRAEGQRIGGFVVQRDGIEVGSVLWRVFAAS